MTPAIAALVIGAILVIAAKDGRSPLDVALGRQTKDYPTIDTNTFGSLSPSPRGDGSGDPLSTVISECNRIDALQLPYQWGGGHAGYPRNGPFDCSGAVSYVLHAAGLLKGPPLTSGLFATTWGTRGEGNHLTVWANAGHVFLEVNGRIWQTSHSNPGGGPGWTDQRSKVGFVPRHIKGL